MAPPPSSSKKASSSQEDNVVTYADSLKFGDLVKWTEPQKKEEVSQTDNLISGIIDEFETMKICVGKNSKNINKKGLKCSKCAVPLSSKSATMHYALGCSHFEQ